MRIDSHQHFWTYTEDEFGWITDEMGGLRCDFGPGDLEPVLAAAGMDGCVAVQARQTVDETQFLLSLADEFDFILGVVGWVDLRGATLVEDLERWTSHPKLVGMRHIVQGEGPGFMEGESFRAGVRTLGDFGLAYDLLIREHQMREAVDFVGAVDGVPIVLDHIGKPNIRSGQWEEWASMLWELSRFEHVFCKLSGMSFEADWSTWTGETLRPYVAHVLSCFGAERCLFGSDWPVCLPAGSYERTVGELSSVLSGLSAEESAAVWGGTAVRVYGLSGG